VRACVLCLCCCFRYGFAPAPAQITKSMKMVSAAKLRGDTERLNLGRPFGATVQALLSAKPEADEVPLPAFKKPLYVVVSSDRGLCGGVNSFVAKEARAQMAADIEKGADPQVLVAGDKAAAQLARLYPDRLIGQILERSKLPANISKALLIADRVRGARPDADCYKIVFNKFVSAIRYDTTTLTVPNYYLLSSTGGEGGEGTNVLPFPLQRYEGELESQEEALVNLTDYVLGVQLYNSFVESATSEQSARMQAMDNATKNAGEMVEKLTVRYNRARQAKITTELIEIISGAESLKS
jgi:F-type H+-transporting ATPase subunit gamma